MERPLQCSRKNTHTLFYIASVSAIISCLILSTMVVYTLYTSSHIDHLVIDMRQIIDEVKLILPNIRQTMETLKKECDPENITKTYITQINQILNRQQNQYVP